MENAEKILALVDAADTRLNDENADRQLLLEHLIADVRGALKPAPATVKVELYKPSGKYYTEEPWRIPQGAIGPYDMKDSPDFRRITNGTVVVPAQEPWGFPHIFPGPSEDTEMLTLIRREANRARETARGSDNPTYLRAVLEVLIRTIEDVA